MSLAACVFHIEVISLALRCPNRSCHRFINDCSFLFAIHASEGEPKDKRDY